jgi:hypothetical protein
VQEKGGDQEPEIDHNEEWAARNSGQLPEL